MRSPRFSVFISFVLMLVLGVFVFVAHKQGHFKLKTLDIQLEEAAPASYGVYATSLRSELSVILGTDLWALNLKQVEKSIREQEWVQDVQISRKFPDRLILQISTRAPIALLLDRKGQMRPLAISAEVLPSIRPDQAPDLPVIQDAKIENNPILRSKIAKLLSELPTEGRLTLQTVDSVSLGKTGKILIHHRSNKAAIHLGEEDILLRSARVARVLDYLDHNQISWKEINADFQKKVVVKKTAALSPDLHIAQ